ncbi:pentatricopeptide repeat-containing protein [Cocos nucifera]|nr:pentatricopeptide repeat-containing protein [Cocos nucifera]
MECTRLSSLPDNLSSYLKCRAIDPRVVHGVSFRLGCLCSTFLSNNLLQVYVSRFMIVDARKLFDITPQRNVVTWSTMISGYAQIGNLKDAIFLLREMLASRIPEKEDENGLLPNKFTFGSTVVGCARANDLRTGVQIHCNIIKFGVESDTFVAGALIDMYSKCGKVKESWNIFDQTPIKDVVSWTTMITSLANSGWHHLWDYAFKLFKDMICRGIQPVGMTFASLVKTFDAPMKLSQAKQAHGCMVKLGIEVDDLMGSALIAMYGRCGGMDEVMRLSDRINHDVVSRTSLLVAYMQNGFNVEAVDVFHKMIEEKFIMDVFVFASVIGACSILEELGMGKEIHCHALRKGFTSDVSVSNALITLYGRCGEIRKAQRVFQLMRDRDMISWTALLTCYSQNGYGEEALLLFRQMLQEGLSPPIFSITSAIRACSTTASLFMGQQIHSRIVKMGSADNLSVENSLITMYAKCGSIEVAKRVFNSMTNRDIVSWNALIVAFLASCKVHGNVELAKIAAKNILQVRPEDPTPYIILSGIHASMGVWDAKARFRAMMKDQGLQKEPGRSWVEAQDCSEDIFDILQVGGI